MLPNNSIVSGVYEGPQGLLSTAREGSLLVDSSTVDPALSKHLAAQAAARGCQFVDAPVSGGVNAAAAGTLTFMVGAETEAVFAQAEKLLGEMGAKVTHCGGGGTGGAVKICNNMLLAITMIGTSEAMNLGIKYLLQSSDSSSLTPPCQAGSGAQAAGQYHGICHRPLLACGHLQSMPGGLPQRSLQ